MARPAFPWLALVLGTALCGYGRGLAAAGLEWQAESGYRWAPLAVQGSSPAGFTLMPAPVTGISFTNRIAEERSITNRVLLGGAGVAAGDIDGDGRCDLYFCRLDGDNVLYRNLGHWQFEDVTGQAGVAAPNLDCTGTVLADVDGDGDVDLLVNTLGAGTRLYQNDGGGRFGDVTAVAGLESRWAGMTMALADVDGDGDLDLYVAHYRSSTLMDRPTTRFTARMVRGQPIVVAVDGRPATSLEYTNRFIVASSGQVLELGEPDALYLNDGHGRFRLLSFTSGAFLDEDGRPLTEPPRDWSLTARFHDVNGDGAPDLYVCSDFFTPDRFWFNDGQGRFRAIARTGLRHTSAFSMGIDFADIDRDGQVDFFVTDMLSRDHRKRQVQVAEKVPMVWPPGFIENRPQVSQNTLQSGRGDETFAEISFFAGVEASEWSWGPIFLDVDLDGFEDLIVPSGQWGDFQNADIAARIEELKAAQRLNPRELLELLKLFPRLDTASLVFRNRGDRTFEEVGASLGMSAQAVSQGMCLADLDADGDLDVIVNNLNSEASLYRNDSSRPRVAVRLRGIAPNTQAIGAKVRLIGGALPDQVQEIISGGRYLSGDDPMRVFAAGTPSNEMSLEVTWRSGASRVINGVRANRLYEIEEGRALSPSSSAPRPQAAPAMFEDVSKLIGHTHREDGFNDFAHQPLLPNALSQLGPGVAWWDMDGDGYEDVLIGSGRGGQTALFLNRGAAGFQPAGRGVWTQTVMRDQTAIVGLGPGQVLIGSANYEGGAVAEGAVRRLGWEQPRIEDVVPEQSWSIGPLASADVDQDGDLDLFVGGRVLSGHYPEPVTSLLLRNDGTGWLVSQRLEQTGLVSGAVFSDLDNDGQPDLVLACEWGPVRVFHNHNGQFDDWTQRAGLADITGWWNGVNVGDFNGDGRLDIIASNWGTNCRYRASPRQPRRIYFGDLDGNGSVETIEAFFEPQLKGWVPERGLRAVAAAIPFIQDRVRSFEAYGNSRLEDIFGDRFSRLAWAEASTLDSMVFFNLEAGFRAEALPAEAQWAPAFALCVGDVNADGLEDVFLGQNFFAANPDSARCDAGRGLWLKGMTDGKLAPLSGQESGVKVYGEQRGAALGDYDGDGKPDLVVSQNGGATRLFHNTAAKAGLRIRLRGGAANPYAIGAKLRLVAGDRLGPVREIHAGSGYWSQDSPVQVMTLEARATQLWVQWPQGRITLSPLPEPAAEVAVGEDGSVQQVR